MFLVLSGERRGLQVGRPSRHEGGGVLLTGEGSEPGEKGAEFWSDVSHVKRSEQRMDVRNALDGPAMPEEVADETGTHRSHVVRALNRSSKRSIVELRNPDDRRGRLYRRTAQGEDVLDEV